MSAQACVQLLQVVKVVKEEQAHNEAFLPAQPPKFLLLASVHKKFVPARSMSQTLLHLSQVVASDDGICNALHVWSDLDFGEGGGGVLLSPSKAAGGDKEQLSSEGCVGMQHRSWTMPKGALFLDQAVHVKAGAAVQLAVMVEGPSGVCTAAPPVAPQEEFSMSDHTTTSSSPHTNTNTNNNTSSTTAHSSSSSSSTTTTTTTTTSKHSSDTSVWRWSGASLHVRGLLPLSSPGPVRTAPLLPTWHLDMLLDSTRNKQYEKAIRWVNMEGIFFVALLLAGIREF